MVREVLSSRMAREREREDVRSKEGLSFEASDCKIIISDAGLRIEVSENAFRQSSTAKKDKKDREKQRYLDTTVSKARREKRTAERCIDSRGILSLPEERKKG